MSDLIRELAAWLRELWPIRFVSQWEAGVVTFCGRVVGVAGPGLKCYFPKLYELHYVSVAEWPALTRRHDITLRDGSVLSFSATATFRVVDPVAAFCRLDHYKSSIELAIARVLSDELAECDPARFDPKFLKRRNLIEELRRALNDDCGRYGIEVVDLGLTDFLRDVRTVRLLTDPGAAPAAPSHPSPAP